MVVSAGSTNLNHSTTTKKSYTRSKTLTSRPKKSTESRTAGTKNDSLKQSTHRSTTTQKSSTKIVKQFKSDSELKTNSEYSNSSSTKKSTKQPTTTKLPNQQKTKQQVNHNKLNTKKKNTVYSEPKKQKAGTHLKHKEHKISNIKGNKSSYKKTQRSATTNSTLDRKNSTNPTPKKEMYSKNLKSKNGTNTSISKNSTLKSNKNKIDEKEKQTSKHKLASRLYHLVNRIKDKIVEMSKRVYTFGLGVNVRPEIQSVLRNGYTQNFNVNLARNHQRKEKGNRQLGEQKKFKDKKILYRMSHAGLNNRVQKPLQRSPPKARPISNLDPSTTCSGSECDSPTPAYFDGFVPTRTIFKTKTHLFVASIKRVRNKKKKSSKYHDSSLPQEVTDLLESPTTTTEEQGPDSETFPQIDTSSHVNNSDEYEEFIDIGKSADSEDAEEQEDRQYDNESDFPDEVNTSNS
ncbi:hypothetical protein BB560_000775 [Smittium megazygosporum]|uniref:Uncharacterized protein n=1 Tax=Smittium megazygosporum TaxID=133381 RepID=A0A2T9ZJF3_9FUNG|nr:hypothetical protein BB560_000775 [Smittium megazygosporum]